ncbi:MAG: alginate export family protein, partial [Bacteroidales bacterium]
LRNGFQQLLPENTNPSLLFTQRTRLRFTYQQENLRWVITPQDVRLWGDEKNHSTAGNLGDEASLDLHEAFIELKMKSNLGIMAGRLELSYDNEWLLGQRNWNQSGAASDALLIKYAANQWNVHAALSWNTLKESLSDNFYPTDRYKTLAFLWLNHTIHTHHSLSWIFIGTGQTLSDTVNNLHFRYTTGVFYRMSGSNLSGDANFYYQLGKNLAGQKVSAFLGAGNLIYNGEKLKPGIGFTVSSGNKNPGKGTDHVFDLIYSARHKFLGNMDYFRNLSAHVRQAGIIDTYLSLSWSATPRLTFTNSLHNFRLMVNNPSVTGTKQLAIENDLILKYKIAEWGAIEYGLLWLTPSSTLKQIQQVTEPATPLFTYLMLTINTRVLP